MRLEPHSGLTAVLPENALSSDVGACAFPGHQGFFIGEAVPTEKTRQTPWLDTIWRLTLPSAIWRPRMGLAMSAVKQSSSMAGSLL
jgi:hypothetical protein